MGGKSPSLCLAPSSLTPSSTPSSLGGHHPLQCLLECWVPLGGSRIRLPPEIGWRAGSLGSISALTLGATIVDNGLSLDLRHMLHGPRLLPAWASPGAILGAGQVGDRKVQQVLGFLVVPSPSASWPTWIYSPILPPFLCAWR
jgi:hypothetical protein